MLLKNHKDAVCDLMNMCMREGCRLCGKDIPCAVEVDIDGVLMKMLYCKFDTKEMIEIDVNEEYL